ncbi:MAG: acetylglutamate kinase [Dehalococcoidales bacterium]|nr:acetylglutamate kinase [Dehalococcoidales bacterium]
MKDITVIKIGGSTLGSRDTTIEDVVALQKKKHPLVVVHGGGSTITEWLKRQGVATRFERGERVTDLMSLEVVTAVLAGLVNKEITAAINIRGGRAVGISGVDGSLVESRVKNQNLGYVGSAEKVNKEILETLLKADYVPVVSPISLYSLAREADAPGIVNANGDPIAGEIAAALKAEKLIFMTDVEGIKDKTGNIISRLTGKEAKDLVESGVVAGGMIPKVSACLKALNAGTVTRIIDGKKSHAMLKEVESGDGGTTIVKDWHD